MSDLIQVRRGTSAQWATANPVLAEGEPGFDVTSGAFKVGNGLTAWAGLSPVSLSDLQATFDARYDIRYVVVPTGWVNVTPTATWVNVGGTAQVARYRKIGDEVYIEGHVKSGTSGTTVFTLPAGFRPPLAMRFASDGGGAYAFLVVLQNGDVQLTGTVSVQGSIQCNFSTV